MAIASKSNNMNVSTVDVATIGEVVKRLYNAKVERPALFYGAPGIGKSAILINLAKEMDWNIWITTGGTLTRQQLYGADFIKDKEEGSLASCQHYVAEWYKQAMEDTRPTLLFLDDMGNANPAEMMVLQQILGDRKLGNYDLPADKFIIVGASNRPTDKSNVFEMSQAIANRLVIINTQLNPNTYLQNWGCKNLHSSVYVFLNENPWALCDDPAFQSEYKPTNLTERDSAYFTNEVLAQNLVHPRPRTWKAVSDYLYSFGDVQRSDFLGDSINMAIIAGSIGTGMNSLFGESLKKTLNVPTIQTLLELPAKTDITTVIADNYYSLSTVCYNIFRCFLDLVETHSAAKTSPMPYRDLPSHSTDPKIVTKETVERRACDLADLLHKVATGKFKNNNSDVIANSIITILFSNSKVSLLSQFPAYQTRPSFRYMAETHRLLRETQKNVNQYQLNSTKLNYE